MRKNSIIDTMTGKVFANTKGLNAALLIGSCAHKEAFTAHSDIDFSIWVDDNAFSQEQFITLINQHIENVIKILPIKIRNKIAVYFDNQPKMEILIFNKLEGLDRHFLGSEIKNVSDSIKYVKDNDIHQILSAHLNQILQKKQDEAQEVKIQTIRDLTDKFIYEFESASHKHYRSDAYRFYFGYNIAFQCAVQIAYIASGSMEHHYLPRKFTSYMEKTEQESFRQLNGSLYLPEANEKKRRLLEFFYAAIAKANVHTTDEINDIKSFLEDIYRRDYIWNCRDIATYNPKCKKNVIFRSSCFVRYQHDKDVFQTVMKKNKISVITDLRDEEEISKNPYDTKILLENNIKYLNISIDTNRPDEFAAEFTDYNDTEKQYRWYALGNKDFFKSFFTQINPLNDVPMIHCHAGKDRTGVLCALIAYLMGETKENIEIDYLASELDSDIKHIRAFINTIDELGGAESFLLSCGITKNCIDTWKNALQNN
ncbi:MAG: tyrosine-protein phosphatase [Bacteroidales bacterium]|nr:tyrosine-protein phosphatase [Bacteroidales bacterium]